ncbi:uncharacterized protein B0H18DRAFT_506749 [Fomitopsis serialis]|uniref:uncharacterized protein n=1 Tax=Fomitopsis serialis TaxID=139415 RepID=UPI0020074A07|nr:uncharacterized protein B0H18DRAFT_506749 [Neoantrodia serialis]KAH9922625.1 hypothetical protein B0H18DRAFT_506749 [Neoantrodia serialis]
MPLKISLMDAEHLLSHLEQHMHRVQRLCLTFLVGRVEKVDTLLSVPLFATPAPVLEGLHLTFDANTNLGNHAFVPRLFDNTARLTRAYFKRCLPWPHNTFPHLTHIFVGCAYAAYNNPPIAEVLDFLEGSPNLEEVVLDGVKVGDLPPSQSSRIVSLPCLRSVVLDNCESLLECFIGHVIPSETVALRCDWFDDAPKGATWRFDILQSGAPFFSRISPVKELSFWTTDYVCGEFCFACRDLVGCVTFNAVLGYSLTIGRR